ncbi:MAG: isopentenyl-diphosphate Delta-isomerase [Gammaproteobacteria bacterium]|jgi:isopentenyl-diphosphate delta-isomerase|nr:isopentenyl-diphosphate Delta-isomerase [Gammaproteobacteria bacterium]MDP6732991.1 isopentenyl-diphosphate Delta-isomerase [Gammaproteobacteria bacterium]|tara:strand:- start:72 stop:590 length:519 start_codon:yes stop_codon:yes gene_type:complete
MNQELVLVDENDVVIGYGEKLQVHQNAQLHRAFSIFVLNNNSELLLQKRAYDKYHSGGLWANTCCSHPVRGEDQEVTAQRRLVEEMGIQCSLRKLFGFMYKAELDNGLTEFEYDHVYLGKFEGNPTPNAEEVCDWKWMNLELLQEDLKVNPDRYAYWLHHAFGQFLSHLDAG